MKIPLLFSFLLLVGCSRSPNSVEIFTKTAELLDQYLNTNALGAEAAMRQLEKYLQQCEKAGYRGGDPGDIKLDGAYGGTYSRLYMVEKALGKDQAADQYYQKACEHWQRLEVAAGRSPPTPAQIRQQIESVDAHLAQPVWKEKK